MTRVKRIVSAYLAVFCLCACTTNEIGTGVGNPPTTTTTKIAAAVTELFSQGSDSASRIRGVVRFVEGDPNDCTGTPAQCLCANIVAGENTPPDGIMNTAFGDPGTYGSASRSVTLESSDFCTEPDGTENPEEGLDGAGRFAFFEIEEDVSISCTGDSDTETFFLKSGSSGAHRLTDATDSAPAYFPQIYGTFIISDGESEAPFNCTIFLLENGAAESVDCSDEDGNSVTQESGVTCEFPGS
jgi:hypothetical protein